MLINALCGSGDQGCLNEASTIYSSWMQDPDGYGKCVILFYSTPINLCKHNL